MNVSQKIPIFLLLLYSNGSAQVIQQVPIGQNRIIPNVILPNLPKPDITGSVSSKDVIPKSFDLEQGKLQESLNSVVYSGAPLEDVLLSVASKAQINLVISDGVSTATKEKEVRLQLYNVTYETVLRHLLAMHGLGGINEGGILKIDTIERISTGIERVQEEQENARFLGQTQVMPYQVKYNNDLAGRRATELAQILSSLLEDYQQNGKLRVAVDRKTNRILVESLPEGLARAKRILQDLDKNIKQVKIEARFVEATSDLARALSVNWGLRFGLDPQRGLTSGIVFPNSLVGSIGGAGAIGSPTAAPGAGLEATQPGAFGFSLGSVNGIVNLDGILRAFETENQANILASLQTTTQDEHTANLTDSLGMRAYPNADNDAPTDLSLRVTPKIMPSNLIQLDITVEKGSPVTPPNLGVRGDTSRTASTKLIIQNGETAVIGGMRQTGRLKAKARIPFLGSLPFIGSLFRSSENRTFRSEILILLTPRVLKLPGVPEPSASIDNNVLENNEGFDNNINNSGNGLENNGLNNNLGNENLNGGNNSLGNENFENGDINNVGNENLNGGNNNLGNEGLENNLGNENLNGGNNLGNENLNGGNNNLGDESLNNSGNEFGGSGNNLNDINVNNFGANGNNLNNALGNEGLNEEASDEFTNENNINNGDANFNEASNEENFNNSEEGLNDDGGNFNNGGNVENEGNVNNEELGDEEDFNEEEPENEDLENDLNF